MPLQRIVIIVLRLFALNWLLAVVASAQIYTNIFNSQGWNSATPSLIAIPLVQLLSGAGLFIFAPPIARLVTPKPDVEVHLGGLTLYDLYCFAFVFLGLYFVLENLAVTFNWVHYFYTQVRETSFEQAQQAANYYQFSHPLLTLTAGLICILGSRKFAAKLTPNRNQAAPVSPTGETSQ